MHGDCIILMLELVEFKKDSTLMADASSCASWLELVEFKKDSTFNPVPDVAIDALELVEFKKDSTFRWRTTSPTRCWSL